MARRQLDWNESPPPLPSGLGAHLPFYSDLNSKAQLQGTPQNIEACLAELTGMLLVFPNCVLHMLEAPTKVCVSPGQKTFFLPSSPSTHALQNPKP